MTVELINVSTAMKRYALNREAVHKIIATGELVPVHTMPQGKGLAHFYKVSDIEPLAKKYLEDREKAKAAKEAAKKAEETKSEPVVVSQDFTPVLDQALTGITKVLEIQNKILRQFDETTTEQFNQLNAQMKVFESQMDTMYKTMVSLEETLLNIHTTPSVPPALADSAIPLPPQPEEVKDPVKEVVSPSAPPVVAEPTQPKKTLTLETKKTSTSSNVGPRAKKADTTPAKPKVLILGLHDNKVRHFNDFQNSLDLTFINPDTTVKLNTRTAPSADYQILMQDFVPHAGFSSAGTGTEEIKVRGGLTKLRQELVNIMLKHNLV